MKENYIKSIFRINPELNVQIIQYYKINVANAGEFVFNLVVDSLSGGYYLVEFYYNNIREKNKWDQFIVDKINLIADSKLVFRTNFNRLHQLFKISNIKDNKLVIKRIYKKRK